MKRWSIRTQLILVICIIMIPVAAFVIYAGQAVLHNSEDRLKDSYQNELDVFAREINGVKEDLKEETDVYFTKYYASLLQYNELEVMSAIEMVDDLRNIWNRTDLVAGAFLMDAAGDHIYVTHDTSLVDIDHYDAIKEILEQGELQNEQNKIQLTWRVLDDNYWFWLYPYGNYVIGFFSPLTSVVSDLMEMGYSTEIEIYLTDLEKNILAVNVEWEGDFEGQKEGKFVFEVELDYVESVIVLMVPEELISSTAPFMQRVLAQSSLLIIIVIPLLWVLIRWLLQRPLEELQHAMAEIEKKNMDYRMNSDKAHSLEIQYIFEQFNEMVQQIEDLKIEKYETEIQKREIETMNLRLQINPHLLLNSLNLISSLSQIPDCATIHKFTLYLAEYFRYTLRNPESMVCLCDELKFVKNYLEIQKIRYPGTFVAVFQVEENTENLLIPALLIENFVENSIKYALKMGNEIEIIVIARREEEDLIVSVIDNGNGMETEILEALRRGDIITNKTGKHIGIWNVRRRLQIEYKDNVEMNITSSLNEGTQIWIKLPAREKEVMET